MYIDEEDALYSLLNEICKMLMLLLRFYITQFINFILRLSNSKGPIAFLIKNELKMHQHFLALFQFIFDQKRTVLPYIVIQKHVTEISFSFIDKHKQSFRKCYRIWHFELDFWT